MSITQVKEQNMESIPGFDEAAFSVAGVSGSGVLKAKREEGFEQYAAIPAPQNFHEEWRKTDPAVFPFGGLRSSPQYESVEFGEPGPWDDQFDVVVAFEKGTVSVADRSGLLAKGTIQVMPLAEAAETYPDVVREHLQGKALPAGTDKFTALNSAFWNAGVFIHIPAKVEVEKGILLRFDQAENGAVLLPRILVLAGDRSQATVVEHLQSGDKVKMAVVSAKELYVGESACLRFLTLQEWGRETYQIEHDMAVVQKDAQIDWYSLNLGSRVSKLKFGSDVAGEGSSAELDGIFFTDDDQHIDQTTLQIHSAPNTYSRLLYKGAVRDRGHSVYRGIIQAKPGAIKVDAYQTNNNLVLTDGAIADTIPGLLIDADDLKCSHGATIGNLDDNQVFYLRARGIAEHDARKMLILGFYDEILDRIPYAFIRERVHAALVKKLDAAEE